MLRAGVVGHLARDVLVSLRRAGLANTLRIIASTARDADFDRTHGTDTAGYADPREYAAGDPRARRATFYVPTRARPFRAFLARSGVATTGTFVDFGCGRGRALCVAAEHGFRSLTGVEFAPALCRAAAQNLARVAPRVPAARFELVCGDAGEYAVRPRDAVFYFYDPFDDATIRRCLASIRASVAAHPRRVSVVYHNNFAARPTPFDASGWLREVAMPRFGGNAFYLYVGGPA